MPTAVCVLLLLAAALGCKREVAGGRADGPAIYKDACERCHGPGGKPPESLRAQLKVQDLTDAAFKARVSRESIEAQVRNGSSNKIMPAFADVLDDAQVRAVAEYVLRLGE